jgi:ribonuclease P protein component
MLSKSHRLKKGNDFKKVFKSRIAARGIWFDLKAAANDLSVCRFGFLIGLRVSKKATKRNRIKRRLGAAINELIGRIKPGYDIVVIANPRILDKKQLQIKNEFENLIKKINLDT